MPTREKKALVLATPIESSIRIVNNQKVILDSDLARIYGASTKVLNQAVKRNAERFPADFLIKLKQNEWNRFEVTICDLKADARGQTLHALRFH